MDQPSEGRNVITLTPAGRRVFMCSCMLVVATARRRSRAECATRASRSVSTCALVDRGTRRRFFRHSYTTRKSPAPRFQRLNAW